MAPPKGNKFACGHGRPPKYFTDEEAVALGEEFLLWMEEQDNNPKSDVVHLSEWYAEIKGIFPDPWEALTKRECFKGYYNIAKKWMGKRLMKNQKLQSSYGNRFLGIYFSEVKEHEIDMLQAKAKADEQARNDKMEDSVRAMTRFAELFQRNDLNNTDKTDSTDAKS